jgi:alkaline phosphatase
MKQHRTAWAAAGLLCAGLAAPAGVVAQDAAGDAVAPMARRPRARNVILFVGDGMGVSTVTATRVYSVGVGGQLVIDQFPHTALSRTYSADSITPDSAPTMSAMMTGVNTNQSVIGFDETTEPRDFNGDGDGRAPWTLLEQAKGRGMRVGVVTTARVTHATPAATYAHINDRDRENEIALQALPGDPSYNARLKRGLDVVFGGGRGFFVPNTVRDEEGGLGNRTDGRDLRLAYTLAGYTYVWNQTGFDGLSSANLPVLGLFERSHMEYEYDRPSDAGGEPSLSEMTGKAIDLLQAATRRQADGYFLMVESGRIDHAHHEGNSYRALTDTEEFDEAIASALSRVNLRDTLVIVSADHSHVFNIAGYPLRPGREMPYRFGAAPPEFDDVPGHGILGLVYDIDASTGDVVAATDRDGVPYTVLGYGNGPGYRGAARVNPTTDPFRGRGGVSVDGPSHPAYLQEAAVPLSSETHAGEDVAIYAAGPGAELVRGTVKNTHIYEVMRRALGLGKKR